MHTLLGSTARFSLNRCAGWQPAGSVNQTPAGWVKVTTVLEMHSVLGMTPAK